MARIDFTIAETELLRDILEDYVSNLRMEIADTDRLDYRTRLHREKEFLNDLIKRLEAAAAEQTGATPPP